MFFKLIMLKAYALRKVRQYSQCLEICNSVIEFVKDQQKVDGA